MLSVEDQLGELDRLDDLVALINAHVTRSDLVDKNDLAVVVTELKLDIPKVTTG